MRNISRLVLVLGIMAFGLVAMAPGLLSVRAKCPNCFKDGDALNTTKNQDGSVSTAQDGRPRVSWRIDGSWDTQPGSTHPAIWNAANAAFDKRNNSRGVNGEASKYSFHREQNWGQTTITIKKDTEGKIGSGCMRADPKPDGRFEILIKPEAVDWPPEMLIDYLSHEIGHALGLAHPTVQDMRQGCWEPLGNAPKTPTAMGFPLFCGANQNNLRLQPNDVTVANQVQNGNKSDCTEFSKPANLEPSGVGGGYIDPTPITYYPVCYNFYDVVTTYTCVTIDGDTSCSVRESYLYLTDRVCF